MAGSRRNYTKRRRPRRRRSAALGFGRILALALFVLLAFRYKDADRLLRQLLRGPSAIETNPAGDSFSSGLADSDPGAVPEYEGTLCVELNGNVPCFTTYDRDHMEGEHYSELDALGRCRAAWAKLDNSMMPTTERGEIDMIHPSGWRQEKYPDLIPYDPPFLYQRCHLIAYALTGQNANEKNLITGTYSLNMEGMRPYELQVVKYLDGSDDHVLYRVTPLYRGEELLPRGVEMEAWSVEDEGTGICFHVFVHNVQPGIEIDYLTGMSRVQPQADRPSWTGSE